MNSPFDPNSKLKQPLIVKWNKVDDLNGGPTPRPRHGHRGVAIKELMLVFGGGNEGIVDELHVYDVNKNKWFMPLVRGDTPRGFAAYGMITDQGRVFIFGGMIEFGKYSNDMYELQTTRWEWRHLRVRTPQNGGLGPSPRLGHSFTLGAHHYAYVFGGLANDSDDPKINLPRFLNDLYMVNLNPSATTFQWELPQIQGISPPPRESHTAVHFVTNTGKEQLIIYGGMDGSRMNDVWILDISNMAWSNPVPNGIAPLPRSLHTSNVIGNRMFVFGGWVPLQQQDKAEQPDKEWKCTNTLAVLNLSNLTWEQPAELSIDTDEPGARAGHSSVVINKRIYIWSGRDGYKKTWNSQVCCDDMWFLEAEAPIAPNGIQLVRASVNSLEIQWTPIPNADNYLLQIQKFEQHQEEQNRRVIRAMPPNSSVRMVRPSTYRQNRPVMMVQQRPLGLVNSFPSSIRSSGPPSGMQGSPQARTIIVQKATQGSLTSEQGQSQQQKVTIIKQSSANYIQQTQRATFDALQQPVDSAAYIEGASITPISTKTTYATPAVPTIDQAMPTNILDEAMNEAESFVEEHEQQKQLQQEHKTEEPIDHSNNLGRNDEEEKTDESKHANENDAKAKSEAKEIKITADMEQVPATSNDSKEEEKNEEFQQLNEDIPVECEQSQPKPEESTTIEGEHLEPDAKIEGEQSRSRAASNVPTTSQPNESEQKIEGPTNDFRNNNDDSLNQSQSASALEHPTRRDSTSIDQWFDVATVSENKFTVTHYYAPDEHQQISSERAVQQGSILPLESGVFYRFRVCAINSVGQSKWSPSNSFKTCIPGFPGAPSSIKITKATDGAHISWEPPQTTNGQIVEYSVYLAMRSTSLAHPAFVPVYIGSAPNCIVNHQNLQLAHIDTSPKPAIIFRIAARNEKGYGPATQVRWLQDQRPMAMMPPLSLPQQMQNHGGQGKRTYSQHYQMSSHPQKMVASGAGGGGGYYAQTTGTRYMVQPSNVAMVQPQISIHESAPPIVNQISSSSSLGYTTPPPQHTAPQRQTQSASPHHQQQQQQQSIHHHAATGGMTRGTPPQINAGMTVREYLTSGSGGKRLRLE